jgi:hypothetical protein
MTTGDWIAQNFEPERETVPNVSVSRRPFYFLVFAAVVLLVVVMSVFYIKVIRAGQQAANPGEHEDSVVTESSDAPSTSPRSDDSSELSSTRAKLTSLVENPACSDPSSDAEVFISFAKASENAGESASATISDALSKVGASCDSEYAIDLRYRLINTDNPSELVTQAEKTSWITPASPAPDDAIEASEFTTPANNIRCIIADDNVSCSIYVYDYPSPDGCEGKTATYHVGSIGDVTADCNSELNTSVTLDYDTTIKHNGFACSISKSEGVTCWSEVSGHGFQLRRASDRTF